MSQTKVVEEIQEPQDLLREILQKYGITQTQIAEMTGISQSRLSRYLRQFLGNHIPNAEQNRCNGE